MKLNQTYGAKMIKPCDILLQKLSFFLPSEKKTSHVSILMSGKQNNGLIMSTQTVRTESYLLFIYFIGTGVHRFLHVSNYTIRLAGPPFT